MAVTKKNTAAVVAEKIATTGQLLQLQRKNRQKYIKRIHLSRAVLSLAAS